MSTLTPLQQAEKDLADYVATLSPERQAWANELRAKIDAIPDMGDRLKFIINEISEAFGRMTTRIVIDNVSRPAGR